MNSNVMHIMAVLSCFLACLAVAEPVNVASPELAICRMIGSSENETNFIMCASDGGFGRSVFDMPVRLNLEGRRGVAFNFRCQDTSPFTMLAVHLRSGDGWYSLGGFEPDREGMWKRIEIPLSGARREGHPTSVTRIDTIRISGYRCTTNESACAMSSVEPYGKAPDVVVVRAQSVVERRTSERWPVNEYVRIMLNAMLDVGFDAVEVPDLNLGDEELLRASVVVLPYNAKMPKSCFAAIERFVDRGGKVVVAYDAKDAAESFLGVQVRTYAKGPMGWTAQVAPPEDGRVVCDALGGPWIVSTLHGAYIARPWRGKDDETSDRLKNVILGLVPSLAEGLEERSVTRERANREERCGIVTLPSKRGEVRAMWCHSPFGFKDWKWNRSVRFLKENGFDTLMVNVCFAVTAYYRSESIPVSSLVDERGDQLAECLAACRKYGIACHAWRVCGFCGNEVSASLMARMEREGRVQVGFDGETIGKWLCPTHPENRRRELEVLMELAKSGVDGVHLDYMRYPGKNGCFCARCRELFERRIGRKVDGWPAATRGDPGMEAAWNSFRCDAISSLVREASVRVKAMNPRLKISAAVAADPRGGVNDRGQDWTLWCREGWLDFVCPMDYAESPLHFASVIAMQQELVGCSALYPGIGLSCWKDPSRDLVTMADHIVSVRAANLKGFIVFDFSARAVEVLPQLRKGLMSDGMYNKERK